MPISVNDNPPRRTAWVWAVVTIIAICGIFMPPVLGVDGFDGGFAISTISGFIAIMGTVAVVIYSRLAKAVDRALQGDGVLVHWQYSPEEWQEYTEKEYAEDKAAKKGLFLLVAVIAVIVGIGFVIFNPDSLPVIAITITAIIMIIGAAAFISARYDHYRNEKFHGEAFITEDGVYLNRRLHLWKGIGNRFEGASLEIANRRQPLLLIEYSALARHGRNYFTVRVPVPEGQGEAAKLVLNEIRAANPTKK